MKLTLSVLLTFFTSSLLAQDDNSTTITQENIYPENESIEAEAEFEETLQEQEEVEYDGWGNDLYNYNQAPSIYEEEIKEKSKEIPE